MTWHLIWSLIQATFWMIISALVTTTAIFVLTSGEGLGGRKRGRKRVKDNPDTDDD